MNYRPALVFPSVLGDSDYTNASFCFPSQTNPLPANLGLGGISFLRPLGSQRPALSLERAGLLSSTPACRQAGRTERGSPTPSALAHSSPQQAARYSAQVIKAVEYYTETFASFSASPR